MNALTTTHTQEVQAAQNIDNSMYERFIQYVDASPKSIETYTRSLRQFVKWQQAQEIIQPTRQDIIAYRDMLKETHKPTTVQLYMQAVKLFFKWTAQEGLYPDIADRVKGAKISRDHKRDYVTTGQLKDMFSTINRETLQGKRDFAILALMATCGLRTIEISRADIQDIKNAGDSMAIYVQGKGREERTDFVILPAETEKAIRDYLQLRKEADEAQPLFTSTSNNSKGERMSTRTVSGIAKKYLRAAGINRKDKTAHSLRHSAVTISLLNGETIEQAQKFARHANISTTMIYAHHLDNVQIRSADKVAAAIFS